MKIFLVGLFLCVLSTGCISEQIDIKRNELTSRIKELENKYSNLHDIIKEYEIISTDSQKMEKRNSILTDLMDMERSYYKLKCNDYSEFEQAEKLKEPGTGNSLSVQEILSEIKKTVNDKSLFSMKKNRAYNKITKELCLEKKKEIDNKMKEDIYHYTLEQGLIDIQDYYGLFSMFGDLLDTKKETE